MSASDLRQELITRLRSEIAHHEEQLEGLREQIRQLMPGEAKTVNGFKRPGRSRTLVRNDQPLRDVILHVLKEAGEPLRVRDIIERVKSSGYQSKAANFSGIVNVSLSNNEELFEKLSRGVYKARDGAVLAAASEEL
jgi:wyosine [tRNA(Phe)-imidazoG37] synthetase (radical SAM superfamily)